MKSKLKSKGIKEKLRPIPKGRAQFMLGFTKGTTRPLLTLYDTGCYSVLFAEGVPEKELGPAKRKTSGPYCVNGVGDTTVRVNDEWTCSIPLIDGTRQAVEGWSVDRVTGTLPYVDMTKAEAEIKENLAKENTDPNLNVESLKCPPVLGGNVDILLGMLYKNIFPKELYSLDNGLTIYSLKVTPHDKKFTACIGGPHESFKFMAEQAGSWNIVFVNLMEQLETYKCFGAPKLSTSLMTQEEKDFALQFQEWDNNEFPVDEIKSVWNHTKEDEIYEVMPKVPMPSGPESPSTVKNNLNEQCSISISLVQFAVSVIEERL